MNLEKLCQDLIVKKFNSSDVLVCNFKEKKSKPPYGSLHIQFRRGEIEETRIFLTKYPEVSRDNLKQFDIFQTSQFKENIAHNILSELKELLTVSFTPEIYFSSQELIVYNVEPFFSLDYSERQFEVGLSTMAKFHAAGERYKNSNSTYNIDKIKILRDDPFNEKHFRKIGFAICKYFQDIKEIYPNTILDDISTQDIEKQMNIIFRKLEDFGECKKFLINGHYSYCNLIFDVMNTECKISDFSSVSHHSPLFDIFQYVSSFSSKLNWKTNLEKAKILYYDYLKTELKRIDVDITQIFPKVEYEETYELMLPIMKVIFFLRPLQKMFEHRLPFEDNNKSCLCNSYSELSEILHALNLESIEENRSVLSFKDCYSVFKKLNTEEFQLNSFETKAHRGRNGFLGEHYDMTINIRREGKQITKSFFLKGIPRSEALQEFAQTVGSFFKETMFYSRYIPLLKEYGIDVLDRVVPECHFADEHKYIILDDLKSYGYTTLSPRSEIKNDVILAVIEILAKLNASCIILEETIERKTGSKYRLSDTFEQELNEAFFSLAPVIESHRNAGTNAMKALTELIDFNDELDAATFRILAEEACGEQVFFAQPSVKWRNTLCHADFWTKNYMIKSEKNNVEKVMMIDFQTYRYAPPAQDLMAFIYLNTTKESREEFMSIWLDYYYKTFAENLKIYSVEMNDILPRKHFDESCNHYKQFAITQSITHFQIILVPPEIIDPLLEDQAKAREIFLGSRYNLVKTVWQMDDIYRRKLTESVGELRRCLIEKIK